MVETSKIPYSVFYKLSYLRRLIEDKDKRAVVYNHEKFSHILIEYGYLVFKEEDKLADHIDNYKFYRLTDKFISSTDEEILFDLTGKTIEEIKSDKVISITDVPWDYEDVFEALNSADGYFDKVDIGNGVFRKALDFYGFAEGAGVNGHYSCGSKKLREYTKKDDGDYKVIEVLTGKTKSENDEILSNDERTKAIKTMKETADLYGYIVMTEDEYDNILEDN